MVLMGDRMLHMGDRMGPRMVLVASLLQVDTTDAMNAVNEVVKGAPAKEGHPICKQPGTSGTRVVDLVLLVACRGALASARTRDLVANGVASHQRSPIRSRACRLPPTRRWFPRRPFSQAMSLQAPNCPASKSSMHERLYRNEGRGGWEVVAAAKVRVDVAGVGVGVVAGVAEVADSARGPGGLLAGCSELHR